MRQVHMTSCCEYILALTIDEVVAVITGRTDVLANGRVADATVAVRVVGARLTDHGAITDRSTRLELQERG